MKNSVRQVLRFLVFFLQKILLYLSYYSTKPFVKPVCDLWLVGVDEIASYIHNISNILPRALSVSLSINPYYDFKYDYSIKVKNRSLHSLQRIIIGPLLLGCWIHKSVGVFYIWETGFLISSLDGRAYEFSFIKKREKKIVCMFIGNDIRSPKMAHQYAKDHGIDTISTYYSQVFPSTDYGWYEEQKRSIAESADAYADLIFSAPIDQPSYLKRQVYPVFYVYPDNRFTRNDWKFENLRLIRIAHAPSSPIIKGTQVVRAAVKKLQIEGYDFEYNELIGVKNEQVIEALRDAHIVLNQFYAFVPGVFGIEAMAAHCAMLTSADCSIEPTLPGDSMGAWLHTRYWEVYDNLKYLLDNPSQIQIFADKGFSWAKKHCSYSSVKNHLCELFKNEGLL